MLRYTRSVYWRLNSGCLLRQLQVPVDLIAEWAHLQQICVGRNPLWKNGTMNVVEAGWTEGIWGNGGWKSMNLSPSPGCKVESWKSWCDPLGHAEPQMLWAGLDEYGVLGASVARGAGWSLCCSGATKKLSERNEKNHKGSSCSYYAHLRSGNLTWLLKSSPFINDVRIWNIHV